MAQYTKKKVRRTIKLRGCSVLLLVFSSFLALLSSLFLRTYNISLNNELQSIQKDIEVLSVENDSLQIAIQALSARDRVMAIAEKNGLVSNQDNVITVRTVEGSNEAE